MQKRDLHTVIAGEAILITDWLTRHWFCHSTKILYMLIPKCRKNVMDSWKIIYCNSHQLPKAEQNYLQIKGEALAIKCR